MKNNPTRKQIRNHMFDVLAGRIEATDTQRYMARALLMKECVGSTNRAKFISLLANLIEAGGQDADAAEAIYLLWSDNTSPAELRELAEAS